MKVRRKPTNKGLLFNISALYDRYFSGTQYDFTIIKGYHLVPFHLNFFQMQKKRRKESYILVHVSYEKKQGEKKIHVIMYVKN